MPGSPGLEDVPLGDFRDGREFKCIRPERTCRQPLNGFRCLQESAMDYFKCSFSCVRIVLFSDAKTT